MYTYASHHVTDRAKAALVTVRTHGRAGDHLISKERRSLVVASTPQAIQSFAISRTQAASSRVARLIGVPRAGKISQYVGPSGTAGPNGRTSRPLRRWRAANRWRASA